MLSQSKHSELFSSKLLALVVHRQQEHYMPPLRMVEYIAPILMLSFPAILWGASKTLTVAEIALYKGVDREKILLEGAKNEGRLPHPHAALLFLDYLHSNEGQQIAMKEGVSSPRNDLTSQKTKFKKTYLESKYSNEGLETKIGEWDAILRKLFLRRQS